MGEDGAHPLPAVEGDGNAATAHGIENGGASPPLPAASGSRGRVRDFQLGRGSIRHMQLVQEPQGGRDGDGRRKAAGSSRSRRSGAASGSAGVRDKEDDECGDGVAVRLYVGSWSGAVHVISLPRGDVCEVVSSLGGPVYGLRLSGALLLTCCGDACVYVWDAGDPAAPAVPLPSATLAGHSGAVTDFVVTPLQQEREVGVGGARGRERGAAEHRRVVTASYDGTLRVWGLTTTTAAASAATAARHARGQGGQPQPPAAVATCEGVLRGHRGPVWSVEAAGPACVLSASADGTVRVWRLCGGLRAGPPSSPSASPPPPPPTSLTASCVRVLTPYHPASHRQIWCVRVAGELALAGGSDGRVYCWDLGGATRPPAPAAESGDVDSEGGRRAGGGEGPAGALEDRTVEAPAGAAGGGAANGSSGGGGWPEEEEGGSSAGGAGTRLRAGSATSSGSNPNASAAVGAAGDGLLWTYRAVGGGGGRDGIRRLDLVRGRLFTCSSKGEVGTFDFRGLQGPGTPTEGARGAAPLEQELEPEEWGEEEDGGGGAAPASPVQARASASGAMAMAGLQAALRGQETMPPRGSGDDGDRELSQQEPRPMLHTEPNTDGGAASGQCGAHETAPNGAGGGSGSVGGSTLTGPASASSSLSPTSSSSPHDRVSSHRVSCSSPRDRVSSHRVSRSSAAEEGSGHVSRSSAAEEGSYHASRSSTGSAGSGNGRTSRWAKGRPRMLLQAHAFPQPFDEAGALEPQQHAQGDTHAAAGYYQQADGSDGSLAAVAGAPTPGGVAIDTGGYTGGSGHHLHPHYRGGASCMSPLRFGSGPCANLR